MKYHWGTALKNNQLEPTVELDIPKVEKPDLTPTNVVVPTIEVDPVIEPTETIDKYQPAIIKNGPAVSLIDAMTKDQIALECQKLYSESFGMADDLNAEILVGNCVVSNYQEPFEESNIKTAQLLQQEQYKKKRIINLCRQQILQPRNNEFSGLEKQLLIGICVSSKIN